MLLSGLVMALTIAGAVLAVSTRNIVHAIFGLAVSLGGVAFAFLLLGSPFVAAMEVLIYIGGISIAMVFAVMLSSVGHEPVASPMKRVMAALVAIAFFAGVAVVITQTEFGPKPEVAEEAWAVEAIGKDLLDRFNVVFELLSVVLLLAIIGAITIARRDEDDDEPLAQGDRRTVPAAPTGPRQSNPDDTPPGDGPKDREPAEGGDVPSYRVDAEEDAPARAEASAPAAGKGGDA